MRKLEFNAEKHEYSYGGIVIPSVTRIIGDVKIFDYTFAKPERGKRLHTIIQYSLQGCLNYDNVTPEEIEFITSFQNLTAGLVFTECEKKLDNEVYGYCGTCDYYNDEYIGDLKTGKPERWHRLQLAAYMKTADIQTGYLIYPAENRIDKHTSKDLIDDLKVFLAACMVYNFKQKG